MSTFTWLNGVNGDWAVARDWSGAAVPNAATSDALIAAAGTYAVTIAAAESFTVHSLTLNAAGAQLTVRGALTLAGTAPTLWVESGKLSLLGKLAGGAVSVTSGGTLADIGAGSITGSLAVLGGLLTLAAAQTLTVAGAVSLDLNTSITGPGTLTTSGTSTVGSQGIYIDGGATWNNTGSVSVGGNVYMGYPTQAGPVTIDNALNASFMLANDSGSVDAYGSTVATIINAGTFGRSGGTAGGTSSVQAAVKSTGTIAVANGTLALSGGGSLGGTLSGAGDLGVTGGTLSLAAGFASSAAAIVVSAGTLLTAGNASVTGGLIGAGGFIAMASGETLSVSGTTSLDANSTVFGPGTLATSGTAATGIGGLYIDGGATWSSSGASSIGGSVYLGYTTQSGPDTLATTKTGSLLLNDGGTIWIYGSTVGVVSNAGTFGRGGGTAAGSNTVSALVDSTGAVVVPNGTLSLSGGGSLGGTASGAGTLAIAGGTMSLATGFASSVAELVVSAGTLLTAGNASVTGGLIGAGGFIAMASGETLSVSGTTSLDANSTVFGPGTLATSGTAATGIGGLYIDGGATWSSSGASSIGGSVYLGYTTQSGPDTLATTKTGSLLLNDGGTIWIYGSTVGVVSNAGTFGRGGGTAAGSNTVSALVDSTGAVVVPNGTLSLSGGGSLGGTASGAGTLAITGGTMSLAAGFASSVAELVVSAGTLLTAGNASVTGGLIGAGGTIAIAAGQTLTVSGTASLHDSTVITGPGTLLTTGTTNVITNFADLDGGVTWNNTGNATLATLMSAGYPTQGGNDSYVNSGTFSLAAGAGILIYGGTVTASFNNAGTLTKNGGADTSSLAVALTNTGTLAASSGGTLAINGASFVSSGSILLSGGSTVQDATTAAGTIANASGIVRAASGGGTFSTPAGLTNFSGGTLTGGTWQADAATLALNIGGTIAVDAANIVLNGAASVIKSFNSATNAYATLESTLTSIAAGGTLNIGAARNYSSGSALTDAGLIALNGGTFAPGALSVAATGHLLGFGAVSKAFVSAGSVEASGGVLKLAGAVTGAGALRIDAAATLELGAATVQAATFAGSGATLKLDAPRTFGGLLGGALGGGKLVLGGITNVTSAVIASGTLTIALAAGNPINYVLAAGVVPVRPLEALDGLGNTVVTFFRSAQATIHTPEPVALGNVHVRANATQLLTIGNAAPADGLSENLDASLGGASAGITAAGSVTGVAPGAFDTTHLLVGIATATDGARSGTATISLFSDGTGIVGDGAAPASIGTQTVDVSGNVYALAAPSLGSTATLNLGAARVGGTAPQASLTLANGTVADPFQESLVYGINGVPAAFTASLAGGTIAAGGNVGIGFSLGTGTSGDFSGSTATVTLTSTGVGTSGLADSVLAATTLTLNGKVYTPAAASTSGGAVNFGVVHVKDSVSKSLTVLNAGSGVLVDLLTGGTATLGGTYAGAVSFALGSGLVAGSGVGGTIGFTLPTTASGAVSGTAALSFLSHDAELTDLAVSGGTVTVTGTVDTYAVAALEVTSGPALTGTAGTYTLNLGSVVQGGAALSATLGVMNAATGLADLLGGGFALANPAGFTNTGFATGFAALGAGQDEHTQVVTLSSATAGVFSETITVSAAGSNASGYNGALANQTVTITGTIIAAGKTYTLSTAPTVITGGLGNDTFVAMGSSLNSHDKLDGGGGANTLTLQGFGAFDLGAPAKLVNIQTVTASEGQAPSGSFVDTRQTIFLRDGLDLTVNVATGTPVTGNANPETVTIYGGANNDIINLGAHGGLVVLGGTGEIVNAAGGTTLVQATTGEIGALVNGGSGTTTLELTTGGTAALNAATNHVTVQLDAATNLTLGKAGFITAIGSAGADTIVAAASGQILTGGAGADTLTGYSGFGDTFRDTAAGLNGDTINLFGGSDVIDLTNMAFATLKTPTYTAGASSGVLKLSDGTHTAAMTFGGTYTLANFLAVSDTHTGTLIQFH